VPPDQQHRLRVTRCLSHLRPALNFHNLPLDLLATPEDFAQQRIHHADGPSLFDTFLHLRLLYELNCFSLGNQDAEANAAI
jgi:hypothetical protein